MTHCKKNACIAHPEPTRTKKGGWSVSSALKEPGLLVTIPRTLLLVEVGSLNSWKVNETDALLIERAVAKVPKFMSLIYRKWNLY